IPRTSLLQWSRGPETAEKRPISTATRRTGKLQWSRGPETAEKKLPNSRKRRRKRSFNGAAVRRPRRSRDQYRERRRQRVCVNGAAVRRPRRKTKETPKASF